MSKRSAAEAGLPEGKASMEEAAETATAQPVPSADVAQQPDDTSARRGGHFGGRGRGRGRGGGAGGGGGGDGAKRARWAGPSEEDDTPVMKVFRGFQRQLDIKHDKHERLVKSSRDLTIASKRLIFLLQRLLAHGDAEHDDEAFAEVDAKLVEIRESLRRIADEIATRSEHWRFQRAFTPGMQEFIEAYSFYHYAKTRSLLPFDALAKFLTWDDGKELYVSTSDYVLGVADLSGELMRLCVQSVSTGYAGQPAEICSFLRSLYDSLISFNGTLIRDLPNKLGVMKTSLAKAENVCYALRVRGSEVPPELLAEMAAAGGDEGDYDDR